MTTTLEARSALVEPDEAWAPLFHTPILGASTDGPLVAAFAERFMVASKGMRAGHPLVFAPWQQWGLSMALQRNERGHFQYRQFLLGKPRKTAKSLEGASIALTYLVGSPDLGREIYSIAGDRQQARLVFGEARWQVLRNPLLERELKVFRDAIEHPVTGSVYRVLSHDGKLAQGLNPFITIADEALALDTPIPTPTGWTTVGAIRVGDKVLGADGLAVEVTALTPIATGRPCYRVTFMDGTSVVADAGHKWLAGWRGGHGMKARRTDELIAGESRLPMPAPLKLPEADLPIDPYLLGLWLGDGSTGQAYITAVHADAEFYVDELAARGVAASATRVRPTVSRVSLSVVRDDMCLRGHAADWYTKTRSNGVIQRECRECSSLRERGEMLPPRVVEPFPVLARRLGVFTSKAIPAVYLRASFDQRLDLLRGLMDTDGHIATSGSATFVQQDAGLVASFAELARSLGYRVSVRWSDDSRTRTGRIAKVCIGSAGPCPVLLPRKAVRWRTDARPLSSMAIRSVEPVESVPVRCITVAAADHLFLAGEGFTVTHNCHVYPGTPADPTTSELWEAMAQGGGARPESLLIAITTAGNNYETLLGRLYRYAQKVASGEVVDPTFGAAWWAAPSGCDHRDERMWHLANPNLSLGLADIEEMRSACRKTPEATFRRYRLNQFVHGGGIGWMDMAAWERQADPGWRPTPGEEIVMAFDGSVSDDATALVGMTTGARPHLFVLGLWQRPESAPDDWQVPRGEVDAAVEDAFALYKVRTFQADTSYWLAEFNRWRDRWGKRRVLDFTMSNARMVPAAQEFYSAIADGQVWHDGNPRLTEHVGNAVVYETPRGVSIRKDSKDSPRKIDLAVAACMANDARLRAPRRSGPSAWGF